MAVPFICSDCMGDGTRCDCHEKRRPKPYQTSQQDKIVMEELNLRKEWRKFGVDYKPPSLRENNHG